jgi:hypothetical protein
MDVSVAFLIFLEILSGNAPTYLEAWEAAGYVW